MWHLQTVAMEKAACGSDGVEKAQEVCQAGLRHLLSLRDPDSKLSGPAAVACVLGTYKSLRRDIAFANRMGEWAYSRMNGQNFNAEFQRVCSGEGVCFVAGTAIVIRDEALLPMVSQTEVGPVPENASLWSVLGLTCIVAGLAPLVVGRQRESDAERRRAQELLFAEPDELDPFGPESEPQNNALSPLLPEEFNALCDRLFAEEESVWEESGDAAAHLAGNVAASAVSDWPTMRTAAVPFRHDGRQVALLDEPRALPHRAAPSKRAISQRTPSAARPMSLVRRWTGGWVLLCALLAGCCFWMGLRSESPPGGVNPSVASAVSAPGPQTQPIESVRVGQRVIARNPEVAEAERSAETAVEPATWRKLRLVAENRWEDGTDDAVEVETLQPPEWVAEHKAQVGVLVPIPLDLVEMGLHEGLRAQVAANDPCPPIEPGPGKVVLTTINHLNRDVWELTLSDDQGHTECLH